MKLESGMLVKLFYKPFLICYLFANIIGCTSVVEHTQGAYGIYPGVRADADIFVEAMECEKSIISFPRSVCILINVYTVIDMPFSAVLDTLLLPIDLAND